MATHFFFRFRSMATMIKRPSRSSGLTLMFLFLIFNLLFYDVAPAVETTMSTARKYYYGIGVRQNMGRAFKLYLQAAQKGDGEAMFIVGGMYMKGMGIGINTAEAFRWLYSAAKKGKSSKESERILAEFFIKGDGAPQNFNEAIRWYEKAAQSGDHEAQSELGYLYFSGKGQERDYDKARHWFETAARNGYSLAQYNMGILWYTGNGVEAVDIVKAYGWFNLAAANGDARGIAARNFLSSVLSNDEKIQAQNFSTELYREIGKTMK
jgi:TPR repeat protein